MKISIRVKKNVILFLFPLLVLFAKLIRWTLMKSVLVDTGSGHGFLNAIIQGGVKFVFFEKESTINISNNVAFIFSFIYKLFGVDTYIGYEVIITIIYNIIILFLIIKDNCNSYTFLYSLFLMFNVVVLNIFDFCLSKEPFQFIFFMFIYLVLRNNKIKDTNKFILSSFILLLCVFTFRVYYIIILSFTIEIYLLIKFIFNNKSISFTKKILITLSVVFITFMLILQFAKMYSYNNYKELLRVRLRKGSANTEIISIFDSSNIILFVLNYLLTILRLLFPFELIRFGPKYWLYVIYQILISFYLFSHLKKSNFITPTQKIALCIFIGFIIGSSSFEPDFGSWIRHEAVVFPVMVIIFKGNISNNNYIDRGI